MSRRTDLTAHLFRLVHLSRSAQMKRALTAVDPDPHLNFWRLIHGNQLDIAVLEWCKVFGSDSEATHWKKIVPPAEHDGFRNNLLASLGITAESWASYWNEMKVYRDNLAAHHNELNKVASYPILDHALKSSYFYYKYLIKELRALGETRFPDDLEAYCAKFAEQVHEVAAKAVAATSTMKECVF